MRRKCKCKSPAPRFPAVDGDIACNSGDNTCDYLNCFGMEKEKKKFKISKPLKKETIARSFIFLRLEYEYVSSRRMQLSRIKRDAKAESDANGELTKGWLHGPVSIVGETRERIAWSLRGNGTTETRMEEMKRGRGEGELAR